MNTAHLYTIPDTARVLGLSTEELEGVIDKGDLPVVPASEGILIHESDFEAWLRRSTLGEPHERL